MIVNFIPFFKRKNFDDGVKEPDEVKHFNSFGKGYDYYINGYRTSMGWHHTPHQAKFHIASDEITKIEPENGVPVNMIRVSPVLTVPLLSSSITTNVLPSPLKLY